MCIEPLKKAIRLCGGPTALAKILGIRQSTVSNLLYRQQIPGKRVLSIEQVTGGRVTRYELRPDIYGDPPDESQAA